MFLKRMQCPDVQQNDLFIGSTVVVFARQLKLVDYGDVFTRQHFSTGKQTTFAMIKPDAYTQMGKIIDCIYRSGMTIGKLKMSRFNANMAARFLASDPLATPEDATFLQGDVCTGMQLVGDNSIKNWCDMIGPVDSAEAKASAPQSIRAAFGTDRIRNAVHGSSDAAT